MRRTDWNKPTMTLAERLYLKEILRGLSITGGVFFRNMAKWLTFRKGALTTYYPEEIRPDYSPRNRGRHLLTHRANGEVQCVGCFMCATACPAYAIEIQAEANFDDPEHPKSPAHFAIDYSRCIFCGLCVEACPEDAIRMAKEVPGFPNSDRSLLWTNREALRSWQPAGNPAKPYPATSVPGHPAKEGAR